MMLRSLIVVAEMPLWMQILAVPFVWAMFATAVVITAVVVDMVRVYLAGGPERNVSVISNDAELHEGERLEAAA